MGLDHLAKQLKLRHNHDKCIVTSSAVYLALNSVEEQYNILMEKSVKALPKPNLWKDGNNSQVFYAADSSNGENCLQVSAP
jgi:hypothetical protein